MAKQKYTNAFLQKYFNNLADYSYMGEVFGKKERYIKVKHNICGKEYDVSINKFIKHEQRCTCLRKRNKAIIKDTSGYQNLLNTKYGDIEYIAISKYLGRKKPIKIKHSCGYEYEIIRAEYLIDNNSGGFCPICINGTHNSTDIINKRLKQKGYNIELLEEYTGISNMHLVKNNDCGHIYKISIDAALNSTDTINHLHCPICGLYSKNINIERVKKEFKQKNPDIELLSVDYDNTHAHLNVKCNICGNEYSVSRTNVLSGKGCPKCNPNSSKLEKEVFQFIKSIYIGNIVENYRDILEIDIYLPDLKIGIEFDGLYWHSDQFKDKNYHLNKTNYFREKGIRIIHIFEDEWLNKQNIVKSKLMHILNVSIDEKVYARKTIIKEITNIEKTPFLDQYHIQGADRAVIKLGEYYNEELVAVMTFSKLRRSLGSKKSDPGQYELSRFATSKNVIGGFSKMLKYAIKNYDIDYIKTFADLRWSDPDKNVYETNKFILSHISQPNYFYSSGNKRYHRFNFRKNILEEKFPDIYKKELTEFQIMDQTSYSRIWDCGNLVYEMKNLNK